MTMDTQPLSRSIIPQGSSVGSKIPLKGETPLSAYLPVMEATTTQVRWQVSPDGSTWYWLYDITNEIVAMTCDASAVRARSFAVDSAIGFWWIRPVATTDDGTAVAQATALRNIDIFSKGF